MLTIYPEYQAIMQYLLCFISFLLSTLSVAAQLHVDPIQDIRQKFSYIMKAKSDNLLTTTEFSYECPYEPGEGTITFFYEGEALRLVEYSFHEGEHYGGTDQYFVWNDELFFAYYDHGSWRFDYENGDFSNPQTVDEITQKRFYFDNQQPIRCLLKQFERYSRNIHHLASHDVPNQETSCDEAQTVQSTFKLLLEWQDGGKSSDRCSLYD